MKDSLFAMLLTLFEKTLTQLKESGLPAKNSDTSVEEKSDNYASLISETKIAKSEFVKTASSNALRVFTYHEQMKLTKASYQFLMRMLAWDIIAPEILEIVIDQLIFSDSRIVTLEETKDTIRCALMDNLDAEQLAFLDLVLYQREDGLSLH